MNHTVQCGQALYFDPSKTLESTMRALYLIRQVLRDDGHVLIVNSNPSLRPLIQEAAHCSINSNLWFLSEPWTAGALAVSAAAEKRLFKPENQPNARFLASRGLQITNPIKQDSSSLSSPPPSLHTLDKWKLYSRGLLRDGSRFQPSAAGITGKRAMDLLKRIVALESRVTTIPLPKQGDVASQLRLLVALDPSHDDQALAEAHSMGVMTASLFSSQSSHEDEVMSQVTYPIYAGENTTAYQHFLLSWILKVANLRAKEV
jgi:ribosomal protein S2